MGTWQPSQVKPPQSPMRFLKLVLATSIRSSGKLIENCGLGDGNDQVGLKCHMQKIFWTQRFIWLYLIFMNAPDVAGRSTCNTCLM